MSISADTAVTQRTDGSALSAGTIAEERFVQMELTAGLSVEQADAVAGERIMGVSLHSAVVGERVRLALAGVTKITAGATFTRTTAAHYDVTTDSTGRAIPWTVGSGLPKLGRWIPEAEASPGAGNPIWVQLDVPDRSDLADNLVTIVPTVNAEAANVITVDLQATDASGNAVASVIHLECTIATAAMVEDATAFHLGESGAGAELSTTDQACLMITTDANGAAQLEATDVVGASGATVHLRLLPLDNDGGGAVNLVPSYADLTFD